MHSPNDPENTLMKNIMPYCITFIKFVTGFAVIVAAALLILRMASALVV